MAPRLGVNIDHIATLRQARGEAYPSLVDASTICLENGADQLTIHLREDRRHIQDTDVEVIRLVTKKYGKLLNLEMATDKEIIEIALAVGPDFICLVPEKRIEMTTEGGLNLNDEKTFERIGLTCEQLKKERPNTQISLFLEADATILKRACELKIDAVEIHTGDYARLHLNDNDLTGHFNDFSQAAKFLSQKQIACHAGHGLTRDSVTNLLEQGCFSEYNIGHWVICQSVFEGLGSVVANLRNQFNQYM